MNVALMPVLLVMLYSLTSGSVESAADFTVFLRELNLINLGLFLFNVLPIYPLDGGKILRALLWYVMGRAWSLMATVIVGFVGVASVGLFALRIQSPWLGILAVFAGMQCASGYKQAQALRQWANAPRRENVACPSCKANPPLGAFWVCGSCKTGFDTFEVHATCPKCRVVFPKTACPECGALHAYADWASELAAAGR